MPITKATASSIAPAAKGDLVVGSATNDASVLAVGSANQVLTVDSSTTTGLKWATPSSGGMTLLSTTTLSGTSTTISGISGDYVNLLIFIYGATTGAADTLTLAGNGTTSVASTSVDNGVAYSYGTRNVMGTAGPTLANANNSFMYEIFDYADTTHYKNVRWAGIYAGGNYGSIGGGGYYATSAITSFRVGTAAGTNSFSAGTVKIYGVK